MGQHPAHKCQLGWVEELLTPTHPPRLALGPPGFSELRCQWGNFEKQADSHEFLQMFPSWAKPKMSRGPVGSAKGISSHNVMRAALHERFHAADSQCARC